MHFDITQADEKKVWYNALAGNYSKAFTTVSKLENFTNINQMIEQLKLIWNFAKLEVKFKTVSRKLYFCNKKEKIYPKKMPINF